MRGLIEGFDWAASRRKATSHANASLASLARRDSIGSGTASPVRKGCSVRCSCGPAEDGWHQGSAPKGRGKSIFGRGERPDEKHVSGAQPNSCSASGCVRCWIVRSLAADQEWSLVEVRGVEWVNATRRLIFSQMPHPEESKFAGFHGGWNLKSSLYKLGVNYCI